MSKVCEYQGYYLDYDEETGEKDVLKCQLFTDEGEWNEYCYCDEEERNNCILYKYSKYIEEKNKEIERLNNIIELANYYIDKYMYENYAYCGSEDRLKQILSGNEFILKQLQELKGEDKE